MNGKSVELVKQAALREAYYRALLTRITAHDSQAMALFYRATTRKVYALALYFTHNADAAEDVAADVYLQVWRQAGRYNADLGNIIAWLMNICRSRALDYLRRRDRAKCCPSPELLRPDLYVDESDPVSVYLISERNRTLYEEYVNLGVLQQRVLMFAFFKGLTHREIACELNLPLGTVKTLVRGALKRLKHRLQPLPTEHPAKNRLQQLRKRRVPDPPQKSGPQIELVLNDKG